MAGQTLEKLVHQAALQLQGRETGQPHHEVLAPNQDGSPRGFARLPEPSPGDMFFDMEGDPLEEGGLEYLFGIYQFDEQGEPLFSPFWGHDRTAEKKAFEAFMAHVAQRLQEYPNAHIYHYAHYEQTALKKLMYLHGTRETEVDNLLRQGKLVDLYKVVREALRVGDRPLKPAVIREITLHAIPGSTESGSIKAHRPRWAPCRPNSSAATPSCNPLFRKRYG